MTYITLEELMKQAYHEYFMRIAELVNFAGICRQAGVNYTMCFSSLLCLVE